MTNAVPVTGYGTEMACGECGDSPYREDETECAYCGARRCPRCGRWQAAQS